MSSDLEFYVHISPNEDYVGPEFLRQTVEEAELAGFDGIWAGDHVTLPVEIPAEYPFSETGEYWSEGGDDSDDVFQSLGFLAGATTDPTLETNVAVVPYRHPV
jgi:alkanesulfonate monooxygenase SsuD/methylene tetrahydromethanopterin reductase-like flavin-dependent oxidoreductase (luciferase family)